MIGEGKIEEAGRERGGGRKGRREEGKERGRERGREGGKEGERKGKRDGGKEERLEYFLCLIESYRHVIRKHETQGRRPEGSQYATPKILWYSKDPMVF